MFLAGFFQMAMPSSRSWDPQHSEPVRKAAVSTSGCCHAFSLSVVSASDSHPLNQPGFCYIFACEYQSSSRSSLLGQNQVQAIPNLVHNNF